MTIYNSMGTSVHGCGMSHERWLCTVRDITLGQTWEYIDGDKKSSPTKTDPMYATWAIMPIRGYGLPLERM